MSSYVDEAELAIKKAKIAKKELKNGREISIPLVTTSQIRKFLTAVNAVNAKLDMDKNIAGGKVERLSPELQAEVKFLKVKLAYQIGRDTKDSVRTFADESHLMEKIDAIKDDVTKYEEFARYVEALVAFHKFYGGKD